MEQSNKIEINSQGGKVNIHLNKPSSDPNNEGKDKKYRLIPIYVAIIGVFGAIVAAWVGKKDDTSAGLQPIINDSRQKVNTNLEEYIKKIDFSEGYITYVKFDNFYEERKNYFELRALEDESDEIEKIEQVEKNSKGKVEKIWIKIKKK